MRRILVSLGVLVCALVVFGGLWVFGQRGDGQFGDMIFDSGIRIPLWAMAAEQWADNVFLGAGSRSFSYECFTYWSDGLNSGELNPEFVHNEYSAAIDGLWAHRFHVNDDIAVFSSCVGTAASLQAL